MSKKIKISDYGFDILQIESTAACNMACSFCPYPLKDDKISKLNLDDIYNLLDSIDVLLSILLFSVSLTLSSIIEILFKIFF